MPANSIQIDTDLSRRLDKVAVELKRKKEWLVNEAVKQFVEELEKKRQMHMETLEALDSVEKGEFYEGTQVLEWLDSWGTPKELPEPKLRN